MDERKIIIDALTKNSSFAEEELVTVLNVIRSNPDICNDGCTAAAFNSMLSDICKPNPILRQAILTSICKTSAASLPGGNISLNGANMMTRFWNHVFGHDFPSPEIRSVVENSMKTIIDREKCIRREASSLLVSGAIELASSKVISSDLERSQSTVLDVPDSIKSPSDMNNSYLDDGFEEASSSAVLNGSPAQKEPTTSASAIGLESDSALSAGGNVNAYLEYDFDEASGYSNSSPSSSPHPSASKGKQKSLDASDNAEEVNEIVGFEEEVGQRESQEKIDGEGDREDKYAILLMRHSESAVAKSGKSTPNASKSASPRLPTPSTISDCYDGMSRLKCRSDTKIARDDDSIDDDDNTNKMLGALLKSHSASKHATPVASKQTSPRQSMVNPTRETKPTVSVTTALSEAPRFVAPAMVVYKVEPVPLEGEEDVTNKYSSNEYDGDADGYEDEFDTDMPLIDSEINGNSNSCSNNCHNLTVNHTSPPSKEKSSARAPKFGQSVGPVPLKGLLGKQASAKLKIYETESNTGGSSNLYRKPGYEASPTRLDSSLTRDEEDEGPKKRIPLLSRQTSARSSAQILGKKYQPPPEPLPQKSSTEVAVIRANIMAPTKSFIIHVKEKEAIRPSTAGAIPSTSKMPFRVTDRQIATPEYIRHRTWARNEFDRPPPSSSEDEEKKLNKPQSAPLMSRDLVRPSSRNFYAPESANADIKPASAEAWSALQACAMEVHCSEVKYKAHRMNPPAAYLKHDMLNQTLWDHLRVYLKRALRKLRTVYKAWQGRMEGALKSCIDNLNRSYLEQVDAVQRYKDEFINTKNNPLLGAFTSSGTTLNKQFTSSSRRLHKTVILARTEDVHMDAMVTMTKSIEAPMERLSQAFRVQNTKLRTALNSCKVLRKASATLVASFTGLAAKNFAFSDKVRLSVLQNEHVLRNNLQRMAYMCEDLRELFYVSGFEGDSMHFMELRDLMASAVMQITVDNAENYPRPQAVEWEFKGQHGMHGEPHRRELALDQIKSSQNSYSISLPIADKRPTSAPISGPPLGQGNSSGKNPRPHSAVAHNRSGKGSGNGAVVAMPSKNTVLQDMLTASDTLSSRLVRDEDVEVHTENGHGHERGKAWHEEDLSTDEDERPSNLREPMPGHVPAVRSRRTEKEDIYEDTDDFIQEDDGEGDGEGDHVGHLEWPPVRSSKIKSNKAPLPLNTRYKDKRLSAPPSNNRDFVDVRAHTLVEASTSTFKPEAKTKRYSKQYNRMRPLSSKKKEELALQAWPNFMYEAESSSGHETQWHEHPCPGCQKLFKGKSYSIPTIFSVDKDVVQYLRGGTNPLKKKVNLTWREEGEVASVLDRPSSSYRRLRSALTDSKRSERNCKLTGKDRGRINSATMKTATQMEKANQMKEFCSWKCMKVWLRKSFSVQKRYETELLIDLSAGYLVEVD